MKKLILFILLLPGLARAGSPYVLGVAGTTAAESVTYLINENFEGTGAPSNWTAAATYIDYDYTTSPAPLNGSESFWIDSTGGEVFAQTSSISLTGSTVYFGARYAPNGLSGFGHWTTLMQFGTTARSTLTTGPTGYLRVVAVGGTADSSDNGVLSDQTAVYIKARHVIGSGTDTSITVWTSANGTSWTERASSTDGTSTDGVASIRFWAHDGGEHIWDDVRVSESDFNF